MLALQNRSHSAAKLLRTSQLFYPPQPSPSGAELTVHNFSPPERGGAAAGTGMDTTVPTIRTRRHYMEQLLEHLYPEQAFIQVFPAPSTPPTPSSKFLKPRSTYPLGGGSRVLRLPGALTRARQDACGRRAGVPAGGAMTTAPCFLAHCQPGTARLPRIREGGGRGRSLDSTPRETLAQGAFQLWPPAAGARCLAPKSSCAGCGHPTSLRAQLCLLLGSAPLPSGHAGPWKGSEPKDARARARVTCGLPARPQLGARRGSGRGEQGQRVAARTRAGALLRGPGLAASEPAQGRCGAC